MIIYVILDTEYSINQSRIPSLVQRVGYQRNKEKDCRIVQHNLTTALSSTNHLRHEYIQYTVCPIYMAVSLAFFSISAFRCSVLY